MKNDFELIGQGIHIADSSRHAPTMVLLNHPVLESNPLYKSLKTDLEKYYIETNKPFEKPAAKKKSLETTLYSNLHSLLSEVTFTKDANIQQEMLKTVHN